VQPINAIGMSGMGGSLQDKASKRDMLRSDATPLAVDAKVGFKSVGGLDKHVQALKEMVVLPLLYPDVFERFDTQPPRGVLFVGPPGTRFQITHMVPTHMYSHPLPYARTHSLTHSQAQARLLLLVHWPTRFR